MSGWVFPIDRIKITQSDERDGFVAAYEHEACGRVWYHRLVACAGGDRPGRQ